MSSRDASSSTALCAASLLAQNIKLRDALSSLIPWAGELPDGPAWATPAAKARNREMFETALRNACECFPADYAGEPADISLKHEVPSLN